MKKNSLSTAIVAGVAGVAGLAGVANAVNVNPDGLGQVLLYPYYTVNGGNQTLISIVNTTNQAKAVKVRFLEALNSAEVFDFNLYLSPFDVWTASVSQIDGGAALLTGDTSCTVPNAVGKDWVDGQPGPFSRFVPYEFQSNNPDVIGRRNQIRLGDNVLYDITAAERMRQGHIEVIEMGVLLNEGGDSTFRPRAWATHSAGTPANCPALQSAWAINPSGPWTTFPGRAVDAPSGGLFGGGAIVNVPRGTGLSYNADAIDGFFRIGGLLDDTDGSEPDLHSQPGDIQPNLTRARTGQVGGVDIAVANIFDNGEVVTATFDAGVDAVSAVLMARYIYNEFNLETVTQAASEWVITFPTKRLHTYGNTGGDVRPFSDNVNSDGTVDGVAIDVDNQPFDRNGLCETYTVTWWDREERTPAPGAQGPIISPPPPTQQAFFPTLCWESNILAFNQTLAADTPTRVLGATPKQGAHGLTIGAFSNGWARIQFDHPNQAGFQNYLVSEDLNPIAIVGLPVIGFWAADYLNEQVAAGVRANFSQIHKHRSDRDGYLLGVGATPPAFGTALPSSGLSSWTQS